MKKIFGKAKMNVNGTTFEDRQKKLWCLRTAKSAFLTLQREPNNEHDPKAIKVIAHTVSKNDKRSHFCIGYVPKEKAEWMAPAMDAGKIVRVGSYEVVGAGTTSCSLGVKMVINHEMYEVADANAVATEQ